MDLSSSQSGERAGGRLEGQKTQKDQIQKISIGTKEGTRKQPEGGSLREAVKALANRTSLNSQLPAVIKSCFNPALERCGFVRMVCRLWPSLVSPAPIHSRFPLLTHKPHLSPIPSLLPPAYRRTIFHCKLLVTTKSSCSASSLSCSTCLSVEIAAEPSLLDGKLATVTATRRAIEDPFMSAINATNVG